MYDTAPPCAAPAPPGSDTAPQHRPRRHPQPAGQPRATAEPRPCAAEPLFAPRPGGSGSELRAGTRVGSPAAGAAAGTRGQRGRAPAALRPLAEAGGCPRPAERSDAPPLPAEPPLPRSRPAWPPPASPRRGPGLAAALTRACRRGPAGAARSAQRLMLTVPPARRAEAAAARAPRASPGPASAAAPAPPGSAARPRPRRQPRARGAPGPAPARPRSPNPGAASALRAPRERGEGAERGGGAAGCPPPGPPSLILPAAERPAPHESPSPGPHTCPAPPPPAGGGTAGAAWGRAALPGPGRVRTAPSAMREQPMQSGVVPAAAGAGGARPAPTISSSPLPALHSSSSSSSRAHRPANSLPGLPEPRHIPARSEAAKSNISSWECRWFPSQALGEALGLAGGVPVVLRHTGALPAAPPAHGGCSRIRAAPSPNAGLGCQEGSGVPALPGPGRGQCQDRAPPGSGHGTEAKPSAAAALRPLAGREGHGACRQAARRQPGPGTPCQERRGAGAGTQRVPAVPGTGAGSSAPGLGTSTHTEPVPASGVRLGAAAGPALPRLGHSLAGNRAAHPSPGGCPAPARGTAWPGTSQPWRLP
ncbi:skin secretory protein xP2-like [Zonotrichia leucophrys gambelii]|uniref:skin secretory protein xP2-like n=1 Tax=Zonotrichia leucophrys gambelii TaxID=257770 RepID=UPI00313FF335